MEWCRWWSRDTRLLGRHVLDIMVDRGGFARRVSFLRFKELRNLICCCRRMEIDMIGALFEWLTWIFHWRSNPTSGWHLQGDVEVAFELVPPSVNGIELGAPIGMLSELGPADCSISRTFWGWRDLGFAVRLSRDGRLASFLIGFRTSSTHVGDLGPFGGTIRIRGVESRIGAEWAEADILRALGEPEFRFEGDELVIFYVWGDSELVFVLEWTHESGARLTSIVAQSPPTLRDKRARGWYALEV